MVSSCATCPGFFFCENPSKLGGFPSSSSKPSIAIKYESDKDVVPKPIEIEIYNRKRLESKLIDVPIPQTIDDHPLESWMDMNNRRMPIYGSKSTNIFLQLQDLPMRGSIPGEDEDALPFYLSLPPPDDLPTDDNLAYFLSSRMDTFLGLQECFSSAYKQLYLLSANNGVLRHVLFAFVKYLNEKDRVVQSALCRIHLQKAIPQLQYSLTTLNFDEGHILSVPLLAYLAYWWREVDVAKVNLRGFYRMLLHAQLLEQDKYGKVSVSSRMPSLMVLMWRVAVRLDHYIGFMHPKDEMMPPIKSTPEFSRRYINEFIDPGAYEWTECLVLVDELEDLRNLAVHFYRRTTLVRGSADYSIIEAQHYIDQAAKNVIRKVEELEAKILIAATTYNRIHQPEFIPMWNVPVEPFPATRFLHYSPLFKTLHHRFIQAIIVNRATLVHTTITSHPRAGPFPLERLQAAIEISCAFAVLKERVPIALHGRGALLEALLFAGYTFCSADYILGIENLMAYLMNRISVDSEETGGGG